jgi:VIT1/CCC1 family predicted Fe2+/Mn2+ transporter
MEHGPVYFIGGTFGSGSSGWAIAIITALVTALVTALLTFGVGLLHEDHKRHRDMQGLAGGHLEKPWRAVA